MWWLIPVAVSVAAFFLAHRLCETSRSEWGALLVGVIDIALYGFACIVSLVAWLVYFIVN